MTVTRRNPPTPGADGDSVVNNTQHGDQSSVQEYQHFPTKCVLTTLSLGIVVICVLIPMIAFSLPAASRDLPWWYSGVVYHIYPKSFQDSNGDGIGDINGIISRLDYLSELGVAAVWITPMYPSPMVDNGYDISDYQGIDPMFGTMKHIENLIEELHKRDMKIIMDFVPNHSSKQHHWFQESCKGTSNKYADYYVWHNGKNDSDGNRLPPNNWISAFGGPAWSWDETRHQYYLHQFTSDQPDLNVRHPAVREELLNILQYWLDKGVDGFRVDATDKLFEVEDLTLDEPRSCDHNAISTDHSYLKHVYSSQLDEILTLTQEWRTLFDKHKENTGKYIFMTTEVWDQDHDLTHWKKHYTSGVDMPSNFALLRKITSDCDGNCLYGIVDNILKHVPNGKLANWQTSNHDAPRITSAWGEEYATLANMLTLLLPGQATTYYGEEIGMTGIKLSYEETLDPLAKKAGPDRYHLMSRDPSRSPMQWETSQNAGFSSAKKTWLPVHPDYKSHNVQAQRMDPQSILSSYKKLAALRHEAAFQWGWLQPGLHNEQVFSFFRYAKGWSFTKYLITMNVGSKPSIDDYTAVPSAFKIKKEATVIFSTLHNVADSGKYKSGDVVDLTHLYLEPGQGLVIALQ